MPVIAPLHYEVHGRGEPLLLLHGFTGAAVDWAPLVDEWSADFQLIVPDLRGHGSSPNPAVYFRHDAAAGDVLALLDSLGIESIKGLGVSAGGNVLLHLATADPARVKAMVIVSATSHFPEQARPIMRQWRFDLLPAEEQQKMRDRHPGGMAQIETSFAHARAFADSYDDLHFTADDLAKITARTLIIQGDRDPFYPVEISADMAKAIPNSSLWIIPGGGHAPIAEERWPEFVKIAGEFLRAT